MESFSVIRDYKHGTTRKLIFGKFIKKFSNEKKNKKPYIEGEFEDIEEDDERKL